jgi:hypothetical protein
VPPVKRSSAILRIRRAPGRARRLLGHVADARALSSSRRPENLEKQGENRITSIGAQQPSVFEGLQGRE